MPVIEIEDTAGKTIRVAEIDGRRYPGFSEDSLRHAMEAEARSDDVVLVTYPKSGTNWTGTILRYLMSGTTVVSSSDDDKNHFLDMAARDAINGFPVDSPRGLSTHYHADTLSPDFLRKKSKIIYVTRNPRDVVTSFFHHHKKLKMFYNYDGEWDGHFSLILEGKLDYGSWFEHTKGWEKCIKDHPDNPFLVLTYEGMKQDPFGNVKKISDFIGMNHSDEFLKEVVERTTFKSMVSDVKSEVGTIMLRKGTHWAGAILRYLMSGNTVPTTDNEERDHFIDIADRDIIKGYPMDSPRGLSTHFRADTLSPDFIRKKSKIIYVTRNPRDVVTSFFHHHQKLKKIYGYDGEWDGHFSLFLEGKY